MEKSLPGILSPCIFHDWKKLIGKSRLFIHLSNIKCYINKEVMCCKQGNFDARISRNFIGNEFFYNIASTKFKVVPYF